VQILRTEIQPRVAVLVVVRHRDFGSRPLAVFDRPDIDVEETVRLRRDVRDASAIWRKYRIGVNEFVVGQRPRFTSRDIDARKLNRRAAIVSRVDDPVAVWRPVGHRVVFRVIRHLVSDTGRGIDFPDRATHRNSYRFPIGRPGGRPRRRARRGRKIVVVHVRGAGFRTRVYATLTGDEAHSSHDSCGGNRSRATDTHVALAHLVAQLQFACGHSVHFAVSEPFERRLEQQQMGGFPHCVV
jgi:hypothetical protein